MNLPYLKDNSIHYSSLTNPGCFYKTSSSVGSLEFPESGTYNFWKEGDNVNLLKVCGTVYENTFEFTTSGTHDLYSATLYNPYYEIILWATNPDIVTNPNSEVILYDTGTSKHERLFNGEVTSQFNLSYKFFGKYTMNFKIESNCICSGIIKVWGDELISN